MTAASNDILVFSEMYHNLKLTLSIIPIAWKFSEGLIVHLFDTENSSKKTLNTAHKAQAEQNIWYNSDRYMDKQLCLKRKPEAFKCSSIHRQLW